MLSLLALSIGSLLVWPSRWNIQAIYQIGFSIAAYIIPICFTRATSLYPPAVTHTYATILAIGASSYVTGLFLSFNSKFSLIKSRYTAFTRTNSGLTRKTAQLTKIIFVFILAIAIFSFIDLGFVPALAKDPFAAKFFRGNYQASVIADLAYRLSQTAGFIILPLAIALWLDTKNFVYVLIAFSITVMYTLMLTRAPIGYAALLVFGLYCAKNNILKYYVTLNIIVVGFGSALYPIIAYLFGAHGYAIARSHETLWAAVASGAPDVSDQLGLLARFARTGAYTHGLTFIGGLVPGNFKWNPSVWSVLVGTSGSLHQINSGGLRIPGPLMAYTAFGYPAILPVMLLSGLINGTFLRQAKAILVTNDTLYTRKSLALAIYIYFGLFISDFYNLTYLGLLSALFVLPFMYKIRLSASRCAAPPLPSFGHHLTAAVE